MEISIMRAVRDYLGGVVDQLGGGLFHEMKQMLPYNVEVHSDGKLCRTGKWSKV